MWELLEAVGVGFGILVGGSMLAMWLINPLHDLWYSVTHQEMPLITLQGAAAVCSLAGLALLALTPITWGGVLVLGLGITFVFLSILKVVLAMVFIEWYHSQKQQN